MTGEIEPHELRCTDLVRQNGRQGVVTSVKDGLVKIDWDGDDFVSVYSGETFGLLAGATATKRAGLLYGNPVANHIPRGRRKGTK